MSEKTLYSPVALETCPERRGGRFRSSTRNPESSIRIRADLPPSFPDTGVGNGERVQAPFPCRPTLLPKLTRWSVGWPWAGDSSSYVLIEKAVVFMVLFGVQYIGSRAVLQESSRPQRASIFA